MDSTEAIIEAILEAINNLVSSEGCRLASRSHRPTKIRNVE
jgi:hypothetical protein